MSASSPNRDILGALQHIAETYKAQGAVHKYKAYRTAMASIESLPKRITSVSDVRGLQGIGKAMEAKISEMLATGHLQQEIEVMQDPVNAATKLFTSVHGVGPVLARKLVHEHGFRTLDDLRSADFSLPPQVRLGLKYHEDISQRIPFDEIEDHVAFITRIARTEVDKKLHLTCCGSHRRMAPTSGDIDILLTHPVTRSDSLASYVYLEVLVAALRTAGYILDTLGVGQSKFMGFCRLPAPHQRRARRLDMRFITFDCFFPALLYFTGSDLFNVHMRQAALKLGYTVNEYGIYKITDGAQTTIPASPSPARGDEASDRVRVTANCVPAATHRGGPVIKGERVLVFSEEDIFKLLGQKFVEPKDRNVGQ